MAFALIVLDVSPDNLSKKGLINLIIADFAFHKRQAVKAIFNPFYFTKSKNINKNYMKCLVMRWKKPVLALFALIFLANIAFAQPFGPPLYIANPSTLECLYYFAGDEKHFNPRPENYTDNIGYTTDFKSQEQACLLYKCVKTNGRVWLQEKDDPNPDICLCPNEFQFANETGCVSMQKATGVALKESRNISKPQNWILVGILAALALGVVSYLKLGRKRI